MTKDFTLSIKRASWPWLKSRLFFFSFNDIIKPIFTYVSPVQIYIYVTYLKGDTLRFRSFLREKTRVGARIDVNNKDYWLSLSARLHIRAYIYNWKSRGYIGNKVRDILRYYVIKFALCYLNHAGLSRVRARGPIVISNSPREGEIHN